MYSVVLHSFVLCIQKEFVLLFLFLKPLLDVFPFFYVDFRFMSAREAGGLMLGSSELHKSKLFFTLLIEPSRLSTN